jgi:hypothetical protein
MSCSAVAVICDHLACKEKIFKMIHPNIGLLMTERCMPSDVIAHMIFYRHSPWNEHLNLLVRIKFLNLFRYSSLKQNWKSYWSEQSFTGLRPWWLFVGKKVKTNKKNETRLMSYSLYCHTN